jgi:hypothetical protein
MESMTWMTNPDFRALCAEAQRLLELGDLEGGDYRWEYARIQFLDAARSALAQPAPEPPADMLPAHVTAPERIWLNLMGAPEFLPFDDEGVIWSPEQIDETDIAYVRADLTQPAPEPSND